MAIKIIKDIAGTVANVEGLNDSKPIPLNSYTCGVWCFSSRWVNNYI